MTTLTFLPVYAHTSSSESCSERPRKQKKVSVPYYVLVCCVLLLYYYHNYNIPLLARGQEDVIKEDDENFPGWELGVG